MKKQLTLLSILISLSYSCLAHFSAEYWKDITPVGTPMIRAANARTLQVDFNQLRDHLSKAPWENLSAPFNSTFEVAIPLPDGSFETFLIEKTRLMGDGLLQKYPEIRTFHGHSKTSPARRIVLDYTVKGFHAMIRFPGDAIFIDPYSMETTTEYICYTKRDFEKLNARNFTEWEIDGYDEVTVDLPAAGKAAAAATGDELLSYRLAMATTVEYSSFHGNTESSVLSAVQTTVARVNEVYENDLSIRLVLIDSTVNVFYYSGSPDPYTNFSGGLMLGENQNNMDSEIGSANYDIGHVFSTGGGGIASYRSVCGNNKAQGVTGSNFPVGDPFDIDYVAHEVGHQFGGSHTFNSVAGSCSGNRNSSTAWEPGSGSTIMAYAGICSGDNLQSNSNDFFHSGSHTEIASFAHTGTGRFCASITSTGNNIPSADAGTDNFAVPMMTPFELFGDGTDQDGGTLTYIWEELDLGPAGSANAPDEDAPLFRSWTPIEDNYRIFPRVQNLVSNNFAKGEKLPFSTRDMTFRLTVRDNAVGGGGLDWDEIAFPVTELAGPFLVMMPDTIGDVMEGNDLNAVEWDVANTNQFPVNASLVDIYLSLDGGYTFPIQLADDVPNDGFHAVMIPDSLVGETKCRIKIKGVDNIFFDISNFNFTIVAYDGTPNNPMGVAEVATEFMIFPNPAQHLVNVRASERIVQIAITDLTGKQVQLVSGVNLSHANISALPTGVYMMEATLENGQRITRQIVKE